jgi:hypothetical protein
MSAAEIVTQPLSKVDSAIDDTPASPTESKIKHRRTSSTVSGVFNINDLGERASADRAALMRLSGLSEQQADIVSREGECRSCDRTRDTEAQLVSGDDSSGIHHASSSLI